MPGTQFEVYRAYESVEVAIYRDVGDVRLRHGVHIANLLPTCLRFCFTGMNWCGPNLPECENKCHSRLTPFPRLHGLSFIAPCLITFYLNSTSLSASFQSCIVRDARWSAAIMFENRFSCDWFGLFVMCFITCE